MACNDRPLPPAGASHACRKRSVPVRYPSRRASGMISGHLAPNMWRPDVSLAVFPVPPPPLGGGPPSSRQAFDTPPRHPIALPAHSITSTAHSIAPSGRAVVPPARAGAPPCYAAVPPARAVTPRLCHAASVARCRPPSSSTLPAATSP
eukprot:366526-Chlamydomonas_euryale.AAC.9